MINKLIAEIKEKGYVEIDNGELFYKVSLANEINFPDMTPKLKIQLKDENLYNNSYIGYISCDIGVDSITRLPLYGGKKLDKYETKWFKKTEEEVVKLDLRDKNLDIINRYIESKLDN